MRILVVTITARGRQLAGMLPWPAVHGSLGDTVRRQWADVDGFVLFAATGAAVRVVAPLLGDKTGDPAVVCVDDGGRWAVALCGGHAAGANDLARHVGALMGAQPVVTTASDAAGFPGFDQMPGFRCAGDVASVTRALLDGQRVHLHNPLGWPLPPALAALTPGDATPAVVVSDELSDARRGVVHLAPPSLVVGVGTSSGSPPEEVAGLLRAALASAGLAPAAVGAVATIDRKRREPAIAALAAALGVPLRDHPAAALRAAEVPSPSGIVESIVGTPSVAEAAAVLSAGPGATLVVTKRRSATATVAVARRRRTPGRLWVVGLGPGDARHRTPAATCAIRGAEVVIGYRLYTELAADAIGPGTSVVPSPIGAEVERARLALAEAASGRRVALVCSGDAGVYAMASLVYELAPEQAGVDPVSDISVVPGVPAAVAAAAALGAPLGHDHVAISLSDLLTPWDVIEHRLRAAGECDLVVCLYNPRSAGRSWQLAAARDLLAVHRPPATPVGVVTEAGRTGERVELTTMADFDPAVVGMTTCVVVGASSTRIVGGRMVTPRGYRP